MAVKPGDTIKRIQSIHDGRHHYIVPSYGYLYEIHIRPEEGLLPNMDFSKPYRLIVDLIGPDGNNIPISIDTWCRTVEEE